MIEQLPSLLPNATRGTHTLARCHQRLGWIKQRHEAASPLRESAARPRERTALLGFGVVYLCSLAFDVLQVLIR